MTFEQAIDILASEPVILESKGPRTAEEWKKISEIWLKKRDEQVKLLQDNPQWIGRPAELSTKKLIAKYPHRFVENFDASTTLGDVRGKILVIRRQEDCPFGKLLKFSDNAVFDYDCFRVEDVYKEHKTWKKAKIVEKHIREAFENDDPNKWFITFNSVAWDPRHHIPYAYAWGGKARNIRRPLNKALREAVDLKDYNDFGIVFLDFYNDHGEQPQLVHAIIDSNYHEGDVE